MEIPYVFFPAAMTGSAVNHSRALLLDPYCDQVDQYSSRIFNTLFCSSQPWFQHFNIIGVVEKLFLLPEYSTPDNQESQGLRLSLALPTSLAIKTMPVWATLRCNWNQQDLLYTNCLGSEMWSSQLLDIPCWYPFIKIISHWPLAVLWVWPHVCEPPMMQNGMLHLLHPISLEIAWVHDRLPSQIPVAFCNSGGSQLQWPSGWWMHRPPLWPLVKVYV